MASNICIDCKKSCGLCAWSAKLKPVEGWTATPIKKRVSSGSLVDGFYVVACPKFEFDERGKNERRWSSNETTILKQLLKQRLRHKTIALILNKSVKSVQGKIQLLREQNKKKAEIPCEE